MEYATIFVLGALCFFAGSSSAAYKAPRSVIVPQPNLKYGNITLINKGWYDARWTVEWDEVTYDAAGEEIVNHVEWNHNGKMDHGLNIGTPWVVRIPSNARRLTFSAEASTWNLWNKWQQIFKCTIPMPIEKGEIVINGLLYKYSFDCSNVTPF